MVSELFRILELLEVRGIEAIPYKGPVLASILYQNTITRQCVDLDFLIRKQDVLDARDILLQNEYRPFEHPSPHEEDVYFQSEKDFKFWHIPKSLSVELHWRAALPRNSFPIDSDQLWRNAETIHVGGRRILSLSPEDLVLILAANGAKDRWVSLSQICDLAELLRSRPSIDLDRVVQQAVELRCRRVLYTGLLLAADLLDAPIPERLRQEIYRDRSVRRLIAQVCRRLTSGTDRPFWGFEKSLFTLRARDTWRDRLPVLALWLREALSPSAKDRELVALPTKLHALYYLIRPIRLGARYSRAAIRNGYRYARKVTRRTRSSGQDLFAPTAALKSEHDPGGR